MSYGVISPLCDTEATRTSGSVIVIDSCSLQPLSSETVTVYVPADKLLAVAPLPPLGLQLYEMIFVPPPATTVAEPSLSPLQLTSYGPKYRLSGSIDEIIGSGSTKTAISSRVHPLASVIVNVTDPAGKPPAIDGEYVNPPAPP